MYNTHDVESLDVRELLFCYAAEGRCELTNDSRSTDRKWGPLSFLFGGYPGPFPFGKIAGA